jgi:hypothetical protein
LSYVCEAGGGRIESPGKNWQNHGRKLGSPEGTGLDEGGLLAKHKGIVGALKDDQCVRNAAKITGKEPNTVCQVKSA